MGIPRLGYGLHFQVMAPAPGDRSPQGYINLDEDLSPRSSVKLSVNRFIYPVLFVSFLLFFFPSYFFFNQSIVKPLLAVLRPFNFVPSFLKNTFSQFLG